MAKKFMGVEEALNVRALEWTCVADLKYLCQRPKHQTHELANTLQVKFRGITNPSSGPNANVDGGYRKCPRNTHSPDRCLWPKTAPLQRLQRLSESGTLFNYK